MYDFSKEEDRRRLQELSFYEMLQLARCGEFGALSCLCSPTTKALYDQVRRLLSDRELNILLREVCGCELQPVIEPTATPITPASFPTLPELPSLPTPPTQAPVPPVPQPEPTGSTGPECSEELQDPGHWTARSTAR